MQKLYYLEDTDLAELVTELASREQPIYFYDFEDDDGDTWLLATNKELDEDDIENKFKELIDDFEEDNF
jgi:hypothetical protein